MASKPRLLLHICCGPCATSVVERLRRDYEIVGYWDNPNVQPAEEHERRLEAARRFATQAGFELVVAPYDPEPWEEAVRGLEDEPEGGRRCAVCYRLRLGAAAAEAVRRGATHLATTLTIGPQKKAAVINPLGEAAAGAHGLTFVAEDFKKRAGLERSIELSRQHDLYRQGYCGCLYARRRQARL